MTPALAPLIYEVEKEEEKLAIIRPTPCLHYLAELVFVVVVVVRVVAVAKSTPS